MWTASACHKVSLIPILLHCLSQNTLIMGLVCHRGVYGMIWWKSKPMLQIVLNSSILPPVNMGATAWGSLTKGVHRMLSRPPRGDELLQRRSPQTLMPWCYLLRTCADPGPFGDSGTDSTSLTGSRRWILESMWISCSRSDGCGL